MDENEQNPQPAEVDPPAEPDLPPAAETDAQPVGDNVAEKAPRTPLRERAFGIRGMVAVAIAGIILGGAGGAVITAAVSDDPDHWRDGEQRYGRIDTGRFDGQPPVPPSGQMAPMPDFGTPPSTLPEEQSDDDSGTDQSQSS